jgi:hypothetical protein
VISETVTQGVTRNYTHGIRNRTKTSNCHIFTH